MIGAEGSVVHDSLKPLMFIVRDKKWSGSTHEIHKVDYVGANGTDFSWVGGFEEGDETVHIFLAMDAANDPKLGGARCVLDRSEALAPPLVFWIGSYSMLA